MSKIAFIFPGQGAQVCGMGQEFYEQTETGKEVFDKASELLGFSVPELCFEKNDRLDLTEYTQPAMVTASIAMTKVFVEKTGITPSVTAGLSLGEYAAMAAAGVMSWEDAIATVRQRGILMQEAVPAGLGAMAAVLAMDAQKIEEVIAPIDGVQIANYNCPGQIVISGRKEAVAEASERLKEAGAKRVLPLNVSGPFHSSMLAEAGKKLGKVLEGVEVHTPQIPYVANVTAEYVT
ncbi:MAG: ACP S-malonyltransferase, partial [Otoolea sp.]